MSALEQIRTAVLQRLKEGGVNARAAYSADWAAACTAPVLAVGVGGGGSSQVGFSDYLGETYDENTASYQERYGKWLDVTLALDAYSPRSAGAVGCEQLLEQVQDVLTTGIPGFRLGEMTWEEGGFDTTADLFHRRLSLPCSAAFIATIQEETGILLDFRLKGELRE